jgi:hypothetical protein
LATAATFNESRGKAKVGLRRFLLHPSYFLCFGHNVRADGIFRKISNRKPKFDDP